MYIVSRCKYKYGSQNLIAFKGNWLFTGFFSICYDCLLNCNTLNTNEKS